MSRIATPVNGCAVGNKNVDAHPTLKDDQCLRGGKEKEQVTVILEESADVRSAVEDQRHR